MELENNVISYEEFCEKYAKEMNNLKKYNIAYGSLLEKPIQSDTILFVASNLKESDEFSSIISNTVSHKKNKKVVAIAEGDSDLEILQDIVETHPFRTEKSHNYLATAKTIVTDSILPFWFIKRKEQTVIYLCSKNTLSQKTRVDRIHFATALLKSSKILVNDSTELERLHEAYGIKNVYFKPILETDTMDEKINIILGRSANVKEHLFKKEKKSIMIYVRFDESPLIFPCIDFLTSKIDHTKFDITLVLCRKLKDETLKLQIETLDPRVRILQREGVYCGTMEQYRKTQYLVRNMTHFDDVSSEYKTLDQDFLEQERKRIWGDLSVDYVIGFGYVKTIWLSLLDMKDVKGKFYIEPRPESTLFIPEDDASAYTHANQNKLYNIVFDKILFTNPNMISFGIDKLGFDPDKVGTISIAANFCGDKFHITPLKSAKYRDKEYFVLDHSYFTPNKSHVDVIPVPDDNSYITDIRNQDLEDLIARFSEVYKNGETLYIHGETWDNIEPFAILYNMEDRIFSLGNSNWNFEQMGQFYQKLSGYVTTDNHEKANAIRTFTEMLKLPSFELSENGIKELSPEFADISEYQRFVQEELNQLFQ